MGRRRQRNVQLPRRMRFQHGAYYYDHGKGPDGKRHWEKLSHDLSEAKLSWAQIEAGQFTAAPNTVNAAIEYYRSTYMSGLSLRWQEERERHFRRLSETFGSMPVSSVKRQHIRQYLVRHKHPITANKEIASLSVVFNKAIQDGAVDDVPNPCQGVERNPEKARDRYVTDAEFLAVKALCNAHWQAILDFAFLTGWREADIISLHAFQLEDEGIRIRQGKTRRKQVLRWTPELRDVVKRLRCSRKVSGVNLVRTGTGKLYTRRGFYSVFEPKVKKALRDGLIQEKFTFHDLRAKAATDAERQGVNPQRLLGHTTERQTRDYLRSREVEYVDPLEPVNGPR